MLVSEGDDRLKPESPNADITKVLQPDTLLYLEVSIIKNWHFTVSISAEFARDFIQAVMTWVPFMPGYF